MKKIAFIALGCILSLFIMSPVYAENIDSNNKTILIDPGHGGMDGGATSKNGTVEKEINLAIALKLQNSLKECGYDVCMTRSEDVGLYTEGKKTVREKKREDLKKRVSLKTETNCDVFISIHQNMFPQEKCYGAQVWYGANEDSKALANTIQESIKETVKDNNKRVAKPAGQAYLILRDNYEGASILVECGFLSNSREETELKTDSHQQLIVDGIVKGINKYFQEKDKSVEF